ncbi:MAG: sulfite exporter TauE/SafE family protein [Candidatus Marinamargulisbacteria bacterium]
MSFTATLALIIFFSGFSQSVIGFGFGLIFVSFASALFPINEVIPFSFLLGAVIDIILSLMTYRHRPKHRSSFGILMVSGMLGAPIGVWLFYTLTAPILQTILGIFLIIISGIMIQKKQSKGDRYPHPIWPPAMGFSTGILGGLFGVAGPFLSIYLMATGSFKRSEIIFILNVFFTGMVMSSLTIYYAYGAYETIHLPTLLKSIITLCLGIGMGTVFGHVLSQKIYLRLVIWSVLASGIGLCVL